LSVFGVSSNVYRIIVFTGILLFVADRFLILGLIMVVVCLIGWLITPLCKFVHFLASSPKLDRHRPRAMAVTGAMIAGILAFLQWVPFPSHFRAPGVMKATHRSEIYTGASGTIEEILVPPESQVQSGQALLRMSNQELDFEIARAEAATAEVDAQLLAAMDQDPSILKPLEAQRESVLKVVEELKRRQKRLIIEAPHAGTWVSPRLEDRKAMWIPQGAMIGLLLDPSSYEFSASVAQSDADRLFSDRLPRAEVRFMGEADHALELRQLQIIQGERSQLPSPALGWQGGGEVQTSFEDPSGTEAAEPFFEVRGELVNPESIAPLHGRAGKIRFFVGHEPLLPRWIRRFRQLLQKRYQL
jgi:putative peptide zinc metalloprotease protein